MNYRLSTGDLLSALFAVILFIVGVLNIFLVHPVPGVIYMLLAFLYTPAANSMLKSRFDFSIPWVVKIALAIVLVMFTLGVSDLGDMIDKL